MSLPALSMRALMWALRLSAGMECSLAFASAFTPSISSFFRRRTLDAASKWAASMAFLCSLSAARFSSSLNPLRIASALSLASPMMPLACFSASFFSCAASYSAACRTSFWISSMPMCSDKPRAEQDDDRDDQAEDDQGLGQQEEEQSLAEHRSEEHTSELQSHVN